MAYDLVGKVALVTGSTRGIGNAIAKALHAQGCKVAINGRNSEAAAKAATALDGSIAVVGDVTSTADSRQVVAEVLHSFGRLDIVVCNVGSGQSVAPGDETLSEWHRMFATNFWSTTNVVEASREALAATNGVICCISSICGLEVITGAPVTYSVAKAALNAYVRGVARPLARLGIRINAIAVGNILFEGSVWSRKLATNSAETEMYLAEQVAMRRFGSVEDVAALVLYQVSSLSSFSTGAIWTLDGGQSRS
jgi:3-oxoacyl-[acyl-carrier protein] reductase